ncbi:MAG: glycerol kinase GlpK [Pseudomonadales bacterium]|nr:glycerol kinase GlpK [Pseudomonadales bacterium]MCP5182391.1 glycerol kinase GlpK [Pseudomonadales bacterium]
MTHILALDQGTSSSRAFIFDVNGNIVGRGQRTFDMTFPHSGWVEQEPDVLWDTTLSAARAALAQAGLEGRDIAAIGITNQRETTLVWERATGRPVYNAIVWQDRRTAERCNQLRAAGVEADVARQTGLLLDPYFSATKIGWILDSAPSLRARAEAGELCFGTVDTYLIYRLTGGQRHVTDATNASRTLLFDIHRQCWSDTLLEEFGVPRAMLPDVLDCAATFGSTQPELFGAAIPITGVAGDQQAALIGQGCVHPGMLKSTYGTGCFVMANAGVTPPASAHRLLSTVAYRVDGVTTYALEGSIFVAGQAVKWLRDELKLITDPADTERHCQATGGDTGGVYLVPAFTGLGAPHWEPDARALLTGMTLDTGVDEVVTATVASVVYQTLDLLEAMARDGTRARSLRVDGGMVVNNWLCQFLADILAIDVQRPRVIETTVLGAAILAALGAGLFPSLDRATTLWHQETVFQPALSAVERSRLVAGWHRAIRQAKAG